MLSFVHDLQGVRVQIPRIMSFTLKRFARDCPSVGIVLTYHKQSDLHQNDTQLLQLFCQCK